MKKIYSILLCSALVACGDDKDESPTPTPVADSVAPIVNINFPAANDSLLLIDAIEVNADIADETRLDKVQVILTEPGGDSRVVFEEQIVSYLNHRNYKLNQTYQLPQNAVSGSYSITVEAKDRATNTAKDSETFVIHASDIGRERFLKPFENGMLNVVAALEWFGYNNWEYGSTFDDVWLSFALQVMVTTDSDFTISETEWNRFITDFNIKKQSWAAWDKNSDGNLNDNEFYEGVNSLHFYKDWDKDQDKIIDLEEMAAGFFTSWDHNKNGVLSVEEYHENFYTYLID